MYKQLKATARGAIEVLLQPTEKLGIDPVTVSRAKQEALYQYLFLISKHQKGF